MQAALLLTVVYFIHCEGAVVIQADLPRLNDRPIIGVLAEEHFSDLNPKFIHKKYTSFIAASYVKAIESAGARVVPIMIGQNRSYYEEIMNKINGYNTSKAAAVFSALFPGGALIFNASNGYADAGQHIYNIAMELTDAGDYFPVYGICLGFELLMVLAAGRGKDDIRTTCAATKSLPLNFTKDFRTSKMFKDCPEDVLVLLATERVTVNSHHYCVEDRNLKSFNLTKDWRVTSHCKDENGEEFIASVEHKRYPLYGIQFHPEKPAFEWTYSLDIAHSPNALKANRWFIDFFVNDCRKNFHSFNDPAEENKYLIYNYAPIFTGKSGDWFQQSYFFGP